jgi:Outer membrane receptor proteins, mostly Fe transport
MLMKNMKKTCKNLSRVLSTALVLVLLTATAVAQSGKRTITGVVTDASSGETIIGANLWIKGSTVGTTTNLDGEYVLDVNSASDILVVSFIGYQSQELAVGSRSVIDFQLKPDTESLEEVIVVGFQSQKKINLTGAVSAVKGEEVAKKPVARASAALQGMSPGVTVVQNSGLPGSDGGTIRIRGIGTLNDANALVLVDGIAMGMDDLDPNDIESISVLKDASSSAIYGARAANGVILITTKRAKEGKLSLEFSSYAGMQDFTYTPDYVSTEDYMIMYNEAKTNVGLTPRYSQEYINNTVSGIDPVKYPSTNWKKAVLKDNALQQNHSLRISGGNEKARIAVSLGYMNQDGLIRNTDMERYNLRMNGDLKVTKKLSFQADVNLRRTTTNRPYESIWSIFKTMNRIAPTIKDKYPDGSYGFLVSDNYNPLAMTEQSGFNKAVYDQTVTTLKGSYEILNGLTLKGVLAVKKNSDFIRSFKNEQTFYDYDTKEQLGYVGPNKAENKTNRNLEITSQAFLSYKKVFGVHSLGSLFGYSQINSKYNEFWASRDQFPNNDITELDGGSDENKDNGGKSIDWSMRSVFGRLNYAFKDRYLLEANFRYDGSSHFAKKERFGFFPSFSAGWRMSEEEFIKNQNFISNLKWRASWGKLGNHGNNRYGTISVIGLGSDYNYPFGGEIQSGAAMSTLANEKLIWEETEEWDLGVDLSLWNGLLDVTADVYNRRTRDILLEIPIPSTIGLGAPVQNAGVVNNRGWELSLGHRNNFGDFKYSIGFNISNVKNEVKDLKETGPFITGNKVTKEGEAIGSYYGYVANGLFQTADEVTNHAQQNPATAAGDVRYKDLNADGKIDEKDKKVIGSDIPHYTYGLNLDMEYKGWDLSMFFQGVGEVDRYVSSELAEGVTSDNNSVKEHLDRWTPTNTTASHPRLTFGQRHNYKESSYWLKDASYLRLKNIQLGYSFPKGKILGLESLRVYVAGQNLLTFTDFKYGDPETSSDRGAYYPQVKTVTFGVNVKL